MSGNYFATEHCKNNIEPGFVNFLNQGYDYLFNSNVVEKTITYRSETSITYTIQPSDTFSQISELFGISIESLKESNSWLILEGRISSDGNYVLIKPGERLTIPEGATIDKNSDYYNELKSSLTSLTSEDTSELSNITDLLSSSDLTAFTSAIKSQLESELQLSTTLNSTVSSFLTSLTQAEATQPVYRRDPLTLDLDGDGIDLVSLSNSSTFFDLDNDGLREQVGWVKADDGFLVYDSNNNSSVDNVSELFGYENEDGRDVSAIAEKCAAFLTSERTKATLESWTDLGELKFSL